MNFVRAVDFKEFFRFVVTGVVATLFNLTATLAVRPLLPFEEALFVGIAVGFTVSFLMGKVFAFRSREWARAPGEVARFTLVYLIGISLYWLVSVWVKAHLPSGPWPRRWGEAFAILVGASLMTGTSYFGHRFFTYRRVIEEA